jgi:DNA-binding PadR family transcriptional regulator
MIADFEHAKIKSMLSLWIIFLLRKKPMNGYELVKEIERCTKYWKPTTGAIYPALNKLKSEGLIIIEKTGDRDQKIYALTDSGRSMAKRITDNITKRIREAKHRRILDSLMWPDEPEEIREMFDALFIAVFDFRNSLQKRYNNTVHMKKTKEKVMKIIKELKVN